MHKIITKYNRFLMLHDFSVQVELFTLPHHKGLRMIPKVGCR
jgi:hypothetical protein